MVAKGQYNDDVKWAGALVYVGVVETKLSDAMDVDGVDVITAVVTGVITTGTLDVVVSNDGVNYGPIPGAALIALLAGGVTAVVGATRGFKFAKLRSIITVTGGGSLAGKWNGE